MAEHIPHTELSLFALDPESFPGERHVEPSSGELCNACQSKQKARTCSL